MRKVNTVLGPVAVSELGRVLMHEHVFIYNPGWEIDARNSPDRERDLESISSRLAGLLKFGVKTIVDPAPADLGRNVGFLVDCAKRSGVNIIATTGLFNEHMGLPLYFKLREIDEIADWMVWELTEGMSGTGVLAGAIKVATSLGRVTQHEEKVIRAAARAHKRTGAPIISHTEGGTMGMEQVDILEDEGADVSRAIIGHSCTNSDLRYHFDILKRGANIGLDRIGANTPDEVRRGLAMSIIAAGYGSQLMLSQDIVGVYYGRATQLGHAMQSKPQRTYTDIMTSFVPKLREAGVSERSIETCLADLPRKFFGD